MSARNAIQWQTLDDWRSILNAEEHSSEVLLLH